MAISNPKSQIPNSKSQIPISTSKSQMPSRNDKAQRQTSNYLKWQKRQRQMTNGK
jgi:hypothetical protein